MNRAVSPKSAKASLNLANTGKKIGAKAKVFRKKHLALAISSILGSTFGSAALAGPEGGVVTGGNGSITNSGNTTTVNQTSDRMAIDWNTFNVNSDERVEYIQPDSHSVSLNRILSNNGSEIQGRIDANGQVILVNPHGLFLAKKVW